jgi:hypothetical protein
MGLSEGERFHTASAFRAALSERGCVFSKRSTIRINGHAIDAASLERFRSAGAAAGHGIFSAPSSSDDDPADVPAEWWTSPYTIPDLRPRLAEIALAESWTKLDLPTYVADVASRVRLNGIDDAAPSSEDLSATACVVHAITAVGLDLIDVPDAVSEVAAMLSDSAAQVAGYDDAVDAAMAFCYAESLAAEDAIQAVLTEALIAVGDTDRLAAWTCSSELAAAA